MAKQLPRATFQRVLRALEGADSWRGVVPLGRRRNCLGALQPDESPAGIATPAEPSKYTEVNRPGSSEGLFEFYSLLSSVREAQGRCVAVALGAHYGGPLVNAALALQRVRPMPCRLVGIEGDRHMVAMLEQHFYDNGLDPRDHCIINAVVSDSNKPVIFPTSKVRTGANSAFHLPEHLEAMYRTIAEASLSESVLKNILTTGSTGLALPLWEGIDAKGELEMISAVTITDILGAVGEVDYLDIDIQASERYVLPPAFGAITRNVRWIHLGTHGSAIHREMRDLIDSSGWLVIADLLPETTYRAPDREFRTQDGVLVARNPAFPLTTWSDISEQAAA